MQLWFKEPSVKIEKKIFVILSIAILISLIVSIPKQIKTLRRSNKPCCLKGYICKAAMNINK